MFKLISKLHDVLCMLKDFNAMYSTRSNNKLIIEFDNCFYLVEIQKVEECEKEGKEYMSCEEYYNYLIKR